MLHFAASLHPLSLLRGQMPEDLVMSDRFPDLPQHATVRVAGLVTARQRPATAKGYVFVLLEDEVGPINVIVKPPVYERDPLDRTHGAVRDRAGAACRRMGRP
jgi:error-prone DNA polymerase